MSDPIRKPDEFPSRSESILSDTIGLEGYSIETPPRSRIENLLIELKEIIDQGGGSSTAYATSLEITMDEYFVMSATLKNKDGDTLGQVQTVDLPLESVVVNGSYDSINKNVVLTLENGNTISFSVADLVSGLQTEITSNNKLDADLVDDTNSAHKFTTASDISKLAGIEAQANKTTIDDALSDSSTNPVQNKVVKTALDSKADVSTTYTKTEVDTALAGKLGTDTHYAGSSTTGGSANSAAKLDNTTDAGSATQPVYFSSGVPTATTYSLAKSVPADAVFTDTTYESKAAASGGTDVSLVTTGDKYIWNNKQNTIDANSKLSADLVDDTNATHKFATAAQLSQITTNENNISTDEAALVELVDGGAKNFLPMPSSLGGELANEATIATDGTITITLDAAMESEGSVQWDFPLSAGTFHFSCGENSSMAGVYDCYIRTITSPTTVLRDNSSPPGQVATIASGNYRCYIRMRANAPAGTYVFKPMLCTKAAWDISRTYQPYRPPYQELYEQTETNENNILFNTNNGVKNIYEITNVPTVSGVTITKIDTNTVSLNGTFSSPTYAFFTLSTNNVILPAGDWVVFTKTTGTIPARTLTISNDVVSVTLGSYAAFSTSEAKQIGVYVQFFTNDSVNGSISIMICPKSLYEADPTYQPYAMSNVELTAKEQVNENNILSITPTTTSTEYTATAAETWEKTSLSIPVAAKKAVYFTGNVMYNNAEPLGVGISTGNTFASTSIIAVEESTAGTLRGALSCTGVYYNNSSSPQTLYLWVKYKTTQKNVITLMYRQL